MCYNFLKQVYLYIIILCIILNYVFYYINNTFKEYKFYTEFFYKQFFRIAIPYQKQWDI